MTQCDCSVTALTVLYGTDGVIRYVMYLQAKLGSEYVKKKRSKSRKSVAAASADTHTVTASSATDGAKKKVSAVSPLVLPGESNLKTVKVKVEKDKAVEAKVVKEENSKPAVSDSKRTDATMAVSGVVSLSKKAMKKIIVDLKAVEHAFPFLFPVDLDDAPNYMDYVTQPMDLSTVEKHHKSGKYDGEGGTALFTSDMHLIWDNCVAYNDPVSEIALWAVSLGDQFESMVRAVTVESSSPAAAVPVHTVQASAQVQTQVQTQTQVPLVSSPTAALQGEEIKGSEMRDDRPMKRKKIEKSASTEPPGLPLKAPKRQDLGVIGKRCWKICKEMSADPRSEKFLHPIDLSQAPGYLDVISRPLDITEVKNQLETYENNPRAFYADMMLIFDNCLAYNTEGSDLWLQAAERKVTFDKMYMDAIGTDAQAHMLNRLCPPGDDTISPGLKKAGRPLGSTVAKKIEEAMTGPSSSKTVEVSNAAVVKVDPALAAASARLAADAKAAAALAAAAPPSLQLSVVPLKAGQRVRTIDEVERLLRVLESPDGLSYQEVRDKAVKRARAVVSSFETPCWSTGGLHEILYFGEIIPSPLFCTERYLYPKAYSVKRTIKLCLLPDTSSSSSSSAESVGQKDASYFASSSSAAPFLPVEFVSMISAANGADQPMFIVTIDG